MRQRHIAHIHPRKSRFGRAKAAAAAEEEIEDALVRGVDVGQRGEVQRDGAEGVGVIYCGKGEVGTSFEIPGCFFGEFLWFQAWETPSGEQDS